MSTRGMWWAALGILSFATACGGSANGAEDEASAGKATTTGVAGDHQDSPSSNAGGDGGHATNEGGADAATPATNECTRVDECKETCDATPPSVCFVAADGSLALESSGMGERKLTLNVKVTAVARDVWEPAALLWTACIGPAGTDRIHVSVEDADGKAWDLSLSPEQVDAEHYAVGDALEIDLNNSSTNLVSKDRRLSIRKDGALDLFFIDVRGTSYVPLDADTAEAGITLAPGELTCGWSVPSDSGCSYARVASVVSAGATSVTDPCGQQVGDFEVTSSATLAGQAPESCLPVRGRCDAVGTFFAAGVRR